MSNGVAGASGSSFGGVSISNSGVFAQVLEFNTIADSKAQNGAIAAGVFCNVTEVMSPQNNIVYPVTGGSNTVFGANCSWTYSNIQGGETGTGNINQNLDFEDAMNGNFHLRSSSPCRNTADPAATLDVDFDGDERLQGGRHDMGADEVTE